ncbi:hypothetical protein [Longispora fulva]|uniref:Uncharacterized protein n=1 Tax=Longispora fulva TaxID=619741 RepID=A0A8J7GCI6_9ACTN|nr:hypothetical protein [Longispora fulva]MBG6136089.1 hypothetical protein [Longispora fulva]
MTDVPTSHGPAPEPHGSPRLDPLTEPLLFARPVLQYLAEAAAAVTGERAEGLLEAYEIVAAHAPHRIAGQCETRRPLPR